MSKSNTAVAPSDSAVDDGRAVKGGGRRARPTAAAATRRPATATPVHNLRFWDQLKRTDPKATKPFTRSGGFRGTQIDPTWRLRMMTETFGPIGKGWGYEQLEWTVVEGMAFVCVRVWYRDPETGEQHWTGPQWGGTELVRRRRDGPGEPNDEAFKMSITDALGKCLLQIGLAADVHLGLFDDSKYRDDAAAYYAAKEDPQLRPEAIQRFEAELKERLFEVSDLEGLDELWRSGVSARVRDIGLVDRAAQMRIVSYFSQRKNELQKQEEGADQQRQHAA
ncbi:MAG TPA: hypothetical protein VFG47_19675 [Geminicoccaceae bacterium]|nr:hypothetical protein [Geminicoccaceae bacterium]